MSSPFDALDAALSRVVMDRFGETEGALLRPRTVSQYAGRAADPARPETTICGIFSAGPGDAPIRGNSTGEFAGTTRLASMSVELWLPAGEVAAIPFEIAVGDLIELSDRAGAPVYSVARVQKTDLGDANLILVREDQPE
ncbi:hypothetical protein K2X89_11705 [Myxococcota bacterium]|nr:hypothetical protein [Myxococcota bacterium]